MTTGFQTQQTTFGEIPKSVARPQTVGAKLDLARKPPESRPPEPRAFASPNRD